MLPFITEQETVWERLARTCKTIMLYGMGLGADKILNELDARGVRVAGVFASDAFVRGHSFHGMRVRRLCEIEREYGDFLIAVAFATRLPEPMEQIRALSRRYELVAPHVPVAGEELVDFAFLARHEREIMAAYGLLADEQSRRVFAAVLNGRLGGGIDGILAAATPKEEAYRLIRPSRGDSYLDLGAYDGDTLREVMEQAGGELRRAVAVEPAPKNYCKLKTFTDTLSGDVAALHAGVWKADGEMAFSPRAGRNSALSRRGEIRIPVRSIDSIAHGERFTLIKLDVEGAEGAALEGGREQLARYAPRLIVSAYHRSADTFSLVNLIHAINPAYRIWLRQHPYIPAWDTNLCAIAEGEL